MKKNSNHSVLPYKEEVERVVKRISKNYKRTNINLSSGATLIKNNSIFSNFAKGENFLALNLTSFRYINDIFFINFFGLINLVNTG